MSGKTILLKISSICLILISFVLFLVGVLLGDVELFLFLVFPIIKISGVFGVLSFLSFLSGLVLFFIYMAIRSGDVNGFDPEERKEDKGPRKKTTPGASTRWGGVVFIGPVPLVFGDKGTRDAFPKWWVLLLIGMFLMLLLYLGLIFTFSL